MKVKNSQEKTIDPYGDDHVGSSSDNPIRPDAFELSNPEKIELERVKEEIITKDDIIEKLKVSSTNLQNKYIKIETKCQHLEQDLNKERMELDKQKEELLKKIADTENSEKAQQNLKKIRDDSISTIREKKEEITRLNDFINELQNNLNIASQEFETVKVNLDKVTKERDISNDKIRELETKNNAI